MIPPKTVEEIIDAAKIEDVVGEFITLKRRGVNLIGLCPFHNEKTPSFTVSPAKNICKCFGCGEGGTPVSFLMQHEQMSFPEALRYLAKKYNIEIEEEVVSEEFAKELQEKDSLYLINEFAMKQFHFQLMETDYGKSVGLSYFKGRGFRTETIEQFGLGYASAESDSLTKTAVKKGYNLELLKKAGITTKSNRDFFRNRVQFPIRNLSGKVVGFGGRILVQDKKQPKYINTPDSDIYNKSKILYGAFFAKKSIRKEDECFMVEGYTDVISLHQQGIENVVASSGTSLTVGQIALVKRFTPNITMLYDGDKAGVMAALRGLDLVLEGDMNVKVVLLPEGEDPDSYINKVGPVDFKKYIKETASDFILFKTNLLLADTENDPIKRADVIKDIMQSISLIPDSIKRSVYIRQCSSQLEIAEKTLTEEINKLIRINANKRREAAEREKRQAERKKSQNIQNSKVGFDDGFPQDSPYSQIDPDFPDDEFSTTDQDLSNKRPEKDIGTPKSDRTTGQNELAQEKDLARILIEFGDKPFDEEQTIAEYLLADMMELLDEFDSELYAAVVFDYLEALENNKSISPKYFLHHKEPKIAKLAADMMLQPYEFSENWAKLHVFLQSQEMPEENYTKDALYALNRFKLKKIERLCKKNQDRLKSIDSTDEEYMKILKVHMRLMAMRTELASETGTVILK